MKEKVKFLIKAKKATYAGDGKEYQSSRKQSHDLKYQEDDFIYYDSYLGNNHFIGEEILYKKDQPVWGMNYYGQELSKNFKSQFLKQALSEVKSEMPFRGPKVFTKGDYKYICETSGSFDQFSGQEHIYYKNKKVYQCSFHGGKIISKDQF